MDYHAGINRERGDEMSDKKMVAITFSEQETSDIWENLPPCFYCHSQKADLLILDDEMYIRCCQCESHPDGVEIDTSSTDEEGYKEAMAEAVRRWVGMWFNEPRRLVEDEDSDEQV